MTKPACRLGDQANCPADSHGGDCCPHNVTGPAVSASPDVFINGRPGPGWEIQACTANYLYALLLADSPKAEAVRERYLSTLSDSYRDQDLRATVENFYGTCW